MTNDGSAQQNKGGSSASPSAPDGQRGYGGKPPANVQKPVNLPPPPPGPKQTKDNK